MDQHLRTIRSGDTASGVVCYLSDNAFPRTTKSVVLFEGVTAIDTGALPEVTEESVATADSDEVDASENVSVTGAPVTEATGSSFEDICFSPFPFFSSSISMSETQLFVFSNALLML